MGRALASLRFLQGASVRTPNAFPVFSRYLP